MIYFKIKSSRKKSQEWSPFTGCEFRKTTVLQKNACDYFDQNQKNLSVPLAHLCATIKNNRLLESVKP